MKAGIVICSRVDSSRVPRKCFTRINGSPMIELLLERSLKTGLPVYLAIPGKDYDEYRYLIAKYRGQKFSITVGQGEDPLARTVNVACKHELDAVIRVTHDKIFIEKEAVESALKVFNETKSDYVFSSTFVAGAAFEIISTAALVKAAAQYKNVEHISYAVKAVSAKQTEVDFSEKWQSKHRFLVDFPKDVIVLDLILTALGNECTLSDAIAFMDAHPDIARLNAPPIATVYTCAFNGGKWLEKAMGSVAAQKDFADMEYILIDDCSTDSTPLLMNKFCDTYKNAKWIRNESNLGLASSSNIALTCARGPYIIRLDADDYFASDNILSRLIYTIGIQKVDIIYPDNYFGSMDKVQSGSECHHVGGALFSTRAANHVKFTEGLRGYEGLDFFVRAKDQLKIGYYKHPTFFYRQRKDSLSKTNLEEREKLKKEILCK